jgi:hypothetical protein
VNSRRICALAALLYLPAWFLPAIRLPGESFGGGPTLGWEAFLLALRPLLGTDDVNGVPAQVWVVATAASNVLLVPALVSVCRRGRAVSPRLWWWVAMATVTNAGWLLSWRALRVGYFLWLAAFVLAAHAARSATRETAPEGSVRHPAA